MGQLNLSDAILVLTQNVQPSPINAIDYVLEDRGLEGPQIKFWNDKRLGPQPTPAQLQSVTPSQVALYYKSLVKSAAISELTNNDALAVLLNAIITAAGLTQQQVILAIQGQ